MATYYLDVDDEITSAASRIRSASDVDVAIVLPPGSRVATSRINFRLLAREAQARHRRLSIVAPEAATRALAASAGLPVFGTVAEYEAAQSDRARGASSGAGSETAAALDELAASVPPTPRAGSVVMDRKGGRTSQRKEPPRDRYAERPRRRISLGAVAFLALVVIILGASAFGAYLLLPTATVSITPREDAITPLQFTVKVDPAVHQADPQNLVAPGIVQNFAVDANGSFDATGRKVNRTSASGIVTFTSENTAQTVYVASGTQVWTQSGVVFLTQKAVTIPTADFGTGTRGAVNVAVKAKNAGTSGNVAAGAITNLPGSFGPLISVTNAAATSGGSETTTFYITQTDVDAAKNSLTSQLNQQFNSKITDPSQTAGNLQLFPDTAQLGSASFDPDPQTLLNQQVDAQNLKFDLVATANGTATAVDPSNVRSLADRRARASIPNDRTLVENSLDVELGQGVATGSTVDVPVTVAGRTIARLDLGALKAAIKGKSPSEAKSYLSRYGKVDVSVSPDWVPNLPSYDFRIEIRIVTTTPTQTPGASPLPSGTVVPSVSPSAQPTPSSSST